MVKIEDLTEDQINALPDEVKEAVTSGITELKGARGVIGTLNKKIKDGGKQENGDDNFSKEDMENYLKETKQGEELESFITGNPAFEEKKEKISELMGKGLSLDEAKGAVVSSDETFKNNLNTNQAGISGGDPTGNQSFSNKQSFEDYQSMSKEEQGAYTKACVENYGGLTFSNTHTSDD